MRRKLMAAVVGVLCVASAGWLAACGPKPEKKPATKDQITEMMKKAHEGENAPFTRVRAELKKDAPDWETLAKDAKVFTDLGNVLGDENYHSSPAKYIAAAAGLTKAAKEKDKPAATAAFAKLSKSCSSCHYGR
ncbi:MAG: hypothetical protein JWO38_5464 [Gemmataceae bacterium]|nr:hypothetical protein [Gemmataceae bacterium]